MKNHLSIIIAVASLLLTLTIAIAAMGGDRQKWDDAATTAASSEFRIAEIEQVNVRQDTKIDAIEKNADEFKREIKEQYRYIRDRLDQLVNSNSRKE